MIPFTTNSKDRIRVYKIALLMAVQTTLDINCIIKIINMAKRYEGIFDLMVLWKEETNQNERNMLISDLKDELKE